MKTILHISTVFLVLNSINLPTESARADETVASQAPGGQASASTPLFSKERWGVGYLNYMNGPTFSEAKGGSINHYLTLKHKFNSDWALSAVFQPDSNLWNGNGFMTMGDSFLRLDYPTIYEAANGFKIKGDVRYYAPFSVASSQARTLGMVSTVFSGSYNVGRLSLSYFLIPKFYLNTVTEDGQKIASIAQYASANFKLASLVTLDFALYPVWKLNRNRDAAFNDLPVYPGFTVNFSEAFSVSPYVEIPLLKPEGKTISVGGLLSYTLL